MIYLKKHRYENGDEYITVQDYLQNRNEDDPKVRKHLEFLCLVEEELNYYNQRTSTAFGDPAFERISGKVKGYLLAMGWVWEEHDNIIRIKSGSRTRYIIERPCISAMERNNRQEIASLMKNVF